MDSDKIIMKGKNMPMLLDGMQKIHFTPKIRQDLRLAGNYLFYGLCDSEVILKELGHNLSFSVKSEVLARGEHPHIRNKNIRI